MTGRTSAAAEARPVHRSASMTATEPRVTGVVPSIVSIVPDAGALQSRFFGASELAGLFVPGPCEARVGQRVCLDIALAHERIGLQSAGLVRWKRHKGAPGLPPGTGVEITEAAGRLLRALAAGADATRLRSRARRFQVSLPAAFFLGAQTIHAAVQDVSRSGLFVRCRGLPPVGSRMALHVQLRPGDWAPLPVVVVRHQSDTHRGFGATFDRSQPPRHGAPDIDSIIADVAASATRGSLGIVSWAARSSYWNVAVPASDRGGLEPSSQVHVTGKLAATHEVTEDV